VIGKTVQVAFGPGLIADIELRDFARELAPLVARSLPLEVLHDAADWVAQLDKEETLFKDPDLLKAARQEIEDRHGMFARYVSTRFVESTVFAYYPNTHQVTYIGLFAEWPSPRSTVCAPLTSFDQDDGWPL